MSRTATCPRPASSTSTRRTTQPEFNGTWSNYPYFDSGTVIASGIEQGLFVLRPNQEVMGSWTPKRAAAPKASSETPAPATPSGDQAKALRTHLSWIPRRISFGRFRSKGIRVRAKANEPVAWKFELLKGRKALARKSRGLSAGKRAVIVKPSRRKLGKAKTFLARLRITATDAAGNKSVLTKRIRVVR